MPQRIAGQISNSPPTRYARLSNGFSRKIKNHAAAVTVTYFRVQFHQDSPDP